MDYGFKRAEDLKVGDKVKLFDGSIYEVTSNKYEKLEEPVKVYNFEVEDWHTYYVSDRGILVHNHTNGCGVTTDSTNTEDSQLEPKATETRPAMESQVKMLPRVEVMEYMKKLHIMEKIIVEEKIKHQ